MDISESFRKRTMVKAAVGMDVLQNVLNNICDILKRHEDLIAKNAEKIELKVQQSDFDNEMQKKDEEIANLNNLINQMKEDFDQKIHDIGENIEPMKARTEEVSNTLTEKIDSIHKDLGDQIQTHHMINSTAVAKLNTGLNDCRNYMGTMNNELQEIKSVLKEAGLTSVNALIEKMDSYDEKFDAITKSISNVHGSIDDAVGAVYEKLSGTTQKMGQEIHRMSKQLDDIQVQFMADPKFTQPPSLENTSPEDLTPLVLAVHRDTRRLDGVDKQISAVRIECENVASAMENAQLVLQKFNHNIYDFQCQLDGTRNEILTRFQYLEPFVKWVGANVKDIWSFIQQVGASAAHVASNASRAQDDLFNLINSISTRPLPPIHSLDEALIESSNVQDQLHEKRMNVDFEKQYTNIRPVFKKKWKTQIPTEMPGEIPSFKKTMETTNIPGVTDVASGPRFGGFGGSREDPMLMITLEEIRVKTNKFEQKLPSFIKEVDEMISNIEAKVETKMDISDADRITAKIQKTLKKLQQEIGSIQNSPLQPPQQITIVQRDEDSQRNEPLTTIHFPAGRKRDISQYPNLSSPSISRPATAQSTRIRTSKIKKSRSSRLASDMVLAVQKM